ncbi:MAG: hypothetical protein JF606_12555 [Burkholderiales bacterium]|nr:hypothetical protein [Burkholderiales bacterium]
MKTSERIILAADRIQVVLDANRTADENVKARSACVTNCWTFCARGRGCWRHRANDRVPCFRAEFKL